MAGTVVLRERRVGFYWKMSFEWTTDAAGDADYTTGTIAAGKVVALVHAPGTGGAQPTDLYDVTLLDSDGVDVLNAHGENVSNAAPTMYVEADQMGIVVADTLTLNVVNGGNAKSGKTVVYLKVS